MTTGLYYAKLFGRFDDELSTAAPTIVFSIFDSLRYFVLKLEEVSHRAGI